MRTKALVLGSSMLASHAGMTGDEFEQEVIQWLATHKNSHFDCLYKECIYQPQLERPWTRRTPAAGLLWI